MNEGLYGASQSSIVASMTNTKQAPATSELRPIEIAPNTFVIHNSYSAPGAPVTVHMNAMLIRGAEPVVVDTGAPLHRDIYLEDLFTLVDPLDVRWVFLSHDDIDHYGNVHEVLDACPNATLIANWYLCERISVDRLDVPPTRMRWVNDGETIDAGDRILAAVRPPLYDSPTTRGLFDPTTGVYWASDCFAAPVSTPTAFVDELDQDQWVEGFQTFQVWNSPWSSIVDSTRFAGVCNMVERLGITTIASCHSPTIGASQVGRAFDLLRQVPDGPFPPQPGQLDLDGIVAQMTVAAL